MRPEPGDAGTIYYVAPATTDAINRHFNSTVMYGAASNKVLGVLEALHAVGRRTCLVSVWTPDRDFRIGKFDEATDGDLCFTRISAPVGKVWRRIGGAVNLALWAMRTPEEADRVLLYNFFPEFIPAALVLKLRGVPAFLDIEDAPNRRPASLRDIVDTVSFRVVCSLTSHRRVTVSHRLARVLGLQSYFACYGVARIVGNRRAPGPISSPVRFLFGGTIIPATGLDVFVSGLRALAERPPVAPVEFHVTGNFRPEDFSDVLQHLRMQPMVTLRLHHNLSREGYEDLIGSMDVGLCLKETSGDLTDTTFPSKVIEIASKGLVLISTRTSDVPLIFDDGKAVLLDDFSGSAFADAVRNVVADLPAAETIAQAGMKTVAVAFGLQAVGAGLRDFLDA